MGQAVFKKVHPGDIESGNLVLGEIVVRSWPDEMPEPGHSVSFAGHVWRVTQVHIPVPGGRRCYRALLTEGGTG